MDYMRHTAAGDQREQQSHPIARVQCGKADSKQLQQYAAQSRAPPRTQEARAQEQRRQPVDGWRARGLLLLEEFVLVCRADGLEGGNSRTTHPHLSDTAYSASWVAA